MLTDEALAGPAAGLLSIMDRVEATEDCRERRARGNQWLCDATGAVLLDLGCGAGTATIELARLRPDARAHGVDVNAHMLAVARARAARVSVACTFSEGDATALAFEDESVAAIRAERLLQHLASPALALAEARRALVRGGRLLIVDHDWDAALVASDDLSTTRALLRMFANGPPSGTIGRALPALLAQSGFEAVSVQPDVRFSTDARAHGWFVDLLADLGRVLEPVEADVVDAWRREQRERAEKGAFCVMIPWVVAMAVKG
jgi:SAM-dependent methyltransferase